MRAIIREVEDDFLQRCQLTCKLLKVETFSASRRHIPLSGHHLVGVRHTGGPTIVEYPLGHS